MTVELRAGGTDLSERRRSGVSRGEVLDIGPRPELTRIDGGVVGALVTVADLAADAGIRAGYPGLAAAAAGLATPQIRRMATLGGNLLQHNRCWYYRHPAAACLRKGGTDCPARDGNHRYGVIFDLEPCVAPHPSTLGAALLAYDAMITTDRRAELPVAEVLTDGLPPGELLTAVRLPEPAAGETAAYQRATSRALAEWPLVEAVARLVIRDGAVTLAAVAVGGVAPVPLRLTEVELALQGNPSTPEVLAAAAGKAAAGATPLPMTSYKVPLLVATVQDVLHRAAGLPVPTA
jgi:xanthine dehydrogenase YagS FAD-binding subunit